MLQVLNGPTIKAGEFTERRCLSPGAGRGYPAACFPVFHFSSRSRRTASLAGFFDLTHAFDGPLR